MTSPEPSIVYIALGSNINPLENLTRAIELLRQKTSIIELSSVYKTAPQEFLNQPDFLNIVVKVSITVTPEILKSEVLGWIERELGRVRDPYNKNAPRTIDLDISLWNDEVFEYGTKPWHIPDPDILHYAHVAIPLAEIAPDYLHPVEKIRLAEIAARFDAIEFECFPLLSE